MDDGVANRSMHLRDAAQRVRILHLAAFAMGFTNLAALQHQSKIMSDHELSGMRPCRLDALIESHIGSAQSIDAESRDDISTAGEIFGLQGRKQANGQHRLRSIDERDRLFCLKN